MRLLILASSSPTRATLLSRAGVTFQAMPARIDEESLRAGLQADGVGPRDVADAMAEHKALKIARRHPEALVLGCDQILEFEGQCLGKPATLSGARERLIALRGRTHRLFTAAVLYDRGQPVWRHVTRADLTMRAFSDEFLDDYLARLGDEALHTVGAYAVEDYGIRLFDRIEGDLFGILGLPLVDLMAVLARRGDISA